MTIFTTGTTRPLALALLASSALAPCAARAATGDLIDPLASQTFSGSSDASAVANYPGGGLTTATARQTTGTIAWDANAKKWTITAGGETASFGTADIDKVNSSTTLAVYARTGSTRGDNLTITHGGTSGRFTYRYVSSAFWQRQINQGNGATGRFDALVFGMPTAASAIPKTGSASYDLDLLGAGTQPQGAAGITGVGAFDVDFGSGAFVITGKIDQIYSSLVDGTFTAGGKLASGGGFSAPIMMRMYGGYQSEGGAFTGTIDGRFFGPGVEEVGGTWSLTETQTIYSVHNAMAGTFMGRKRATGGAVTELGQANHFYPASTGSRVQVSSSSSTITGTPATAIVYYSKASGAYTLLRNGAYVGGNIDDGCAIQTCNAEDHTRYVSSATWFSLADGVRQGETSLFGLPTAASAVPTTGGAVYALRVTGNAFRLSRSDVDRLTGTGRLTADFATGSLGLSGEVGRTDGFGYYPSDSGTFTGSGKITADTRSFSGALAFKLGNASLSGAFKGGFYGPKANEVGLTFALKGMDGSSGEPRAIGMVGAMVGGVDPVLNAAYTPLSAYTDKTSFIGQVTRISGDEVWAMINTTGVGTWNPRTGNWTIPDGYLGPDVTLTFGATTKRPDLSDALTDAYRTAAGGRTYTLRVYHQGSADIALSYTGFYTLTAPETAGNARFADYAVFGNQTPGELMPRSGTGKYALAFRGAGAKIDYAHNRQRTDYALTGTGTLSANFGTGKISASGTVNGVRPSGATSVFASFTLAGSIYAAGAQWSALNGNGVSLEGHFYGPAANELGGVFSIDKLNSARTLATQGYGIVVGTRSN